MEARVAEATKFSNTPLPAPILVHKGAQLKNDTVLSDLGLTPSDYLTFLYPVRQTLENRCHVRLSGDNEALLTLSFISITFSPAR